MAQPPSGFGDQPLSPRDSLTIINIEQAAQTRRRNREAALLTAVWGVAYLISWGAFYLNGEHALPVLVAGILTGVLIVGAIVFSAWFGIRSSQGVRGPSQVTGAMYGWSWTLGFLALTAINVGLQNKGLTADQVTLLWSGSALLLVGVLYLVGGAMFRSWPQYVLGAWMLITGAASVYPGVPGNFMVLALAGGGGFLVQAAYYTYRSSGPGRAADTSVPAL